MKYFYSIVLIAHSILGIHNQATSTPILVESIIPIVQAEVIPPETYEDKFNRLALEYGANKKLAHSIIQCESNASSTEINTNKDGSQDWSYWQVNDKYHEANATKLGFDIHKPDDNLEYGFILLREKNAPNKYWSASKFCWNK